VEGAPARRGREDLRAARARAAAAHLPARRRRAQSCSSGASGCCAHRSAAGCRAGPALKTRYHGDYHLGPGAADEERLRHHRLRGRAGAQLEERRAKHSPLRDVAGMLRSFNYARWTALAGRSRATPASARAAGARTGRRARAARSSAPTPRRALERPVRSPPTCAACSRCSSWRRRSTSCATSSTTARIGSASRCKGPGAPIGLSHAVVPEAAMDIEHAAGADPRILRAGRRIPAAARARALVLLAGWLLAKAARFAVVKACAPSTSTCSPSAPGWTVPAPGRHQSRHHRHLRRAGVLAGGPRALVIAFNSAGPDLHHRPARQVCLAGPPYPLGATWDGEGVNFALFSEHAERSSCACSTPRGRREVERVPARADRPGLALLPAGGAPGQLYGYRVHGPYEPERGPPLQPAQAAARSLRAIAGQLAGATRCSATASATPRGPVVRPARQRRGMPKCRSSTRLHLGRRPPPRTPWHDTVIYELHVKGFTRCIRSAAPLRGTYAGLATAPVIDHLRRSASPPSS
jgi:hypothetical protein